MCSSGFAVLQPKVVPPELVFAYLRLPAICELMDLHTTASMYPAISVPNILALPFRKPSPDGSKKIVEQVQAAQSAASASPCITRACQICCRNGHRRVRCCRTETRERTLSMPNLKDNLKQWRDSARIDWFSQFIKAWIPFNAWMTDTFGDLSDRELLDHVKGGSNVVYNRIVPILTWRQAQARDTRRTWQDSSQDAEEFRLRIEQLHRLLQSCVVDGRKGRVSFETVDIGHNGHADEQLTKWTRTFRVRRDHPAKGEVTLENDRNEDECRIRFHSTKP